MIEHFGPYALFAKLGEGASGRVDLARKYREDGSLAEPVALKRLSRTRHDDAMTRRFVHEAAIAVRLDSPYVVRALEFGKVEVRPNDYQHYYTMEYVDGRTLESHLAQLQEQGVRLAMSAAIAIVTDVLGALEAIHELKDETKKPLDCVHRDVKPSNILIETKTATCKLIDMGVAKSSRQDWRTATSEEVRTYQYMAPEQMETDRRRPVDHRADLYAAGLVLFEVVTGERYFRVGSLEDLLNVANPTYRSMSALRPEVPRSLEEVVKRALAPRVEDRFETASEFKSALQSVLQASSMPDFAAATESTLDVAPNHLRQERYERAKSASVPDRPKIRHSTQVYARAAKVVREPPKSGRPRKARGMTRGQALLQRVIWATLGAVSALVLGGIGSTFIERPAPQPVQRAVASPPTTLRAIPSHVPQAELQTPLAAEIRNCNATNWPDMYARVSGRLESAQPRPNLDLNVLRGSLEKAQQLRDCGALLRIAEKLDENR